MGAPKGVNGHPGHWCCCSQVQWEAECYLNGFEGEAWHAKNRCYSGLAQCRGYKYSVHCLRGQGLTLNSQSSIELASSMRGTGGRSGGFTVYPRHTPLSNCPPSPLCSSKTTFLQADTHILHPRSQQKKQRASPTLIFLSSMWAPLPLGCKIQFHQPRRFVSSVLTRCVRVYNG